MVQTNIIINQSDVKTQSVTVADIVTNLTSRRKAWTVKRIYRAELKAARAIARWIDRHPTLSNAILYAGCVAFAIYVFMCK